jgi:hypothetical protein
MNVHTEVQPPELQELRTDPDQVTVCCYIIDPDGTTYTSIINLDPSEPLSNVSAALLSTAYGVTSTQGPVLAALFRDLIETQRAMANATPIGVGLHPGIRVSDVDQMLAAHQGSDHHPHLKIPGIDHPVDAGVVRAILVAAGAY